MSSCFGSSFKVLFIVFILLLLTIVAALAFNEALRNWIRRRMEHGKDNNALWVYFIVAVLVWLIVLWIISRCWCAPEAWDVPCCKPVCAPVCVSKC